MIFKEITYSQLKDAIRIAFKDDEDIYKYYDKNVQVESLNDIVNDVYIKIIDYKNYEGKLTIKGVFEKDMIIGYVAYFNNLLLSFSISTMFRTNDGTKKFYDLIKNDFNSNFFCYLWSINLRAIKWLEKMGMKIIFNDNQLIKLQCQ